MLINCKTNNLKVQCNTKVIALRLNLNFVFFCFFMQDKSILKENIKLESIQDLKKIKEVPPGTTMLEIMKELINDSSEIEVIQIESVLPIEIWSTKTEIEHESSAVHSIHCNIELEENETLVLKTHHGTILDSSSSKNNQKFTHWTKDRPLLIVNAPFVGFELAIKKGNTFRKLTKDQTEKVFCKKMYFSSKLMRQLMDLVPGRLQVGDFVYGSGCIGPV